MNNGTMTDDLINALSLYKGYDEGLFNEWCEDNSGDLFSDMEEILEDDKSEYLYNTYNVLVKQAADKDLRLYADKILMAYVENSKKVQQSMGCYFIDSGVVFSGPNGRG